MQKVAITILVGFLLFMQACSKTTIDSSRRFDSSYAKDYFNPQWQKQGIGKEEWYYRMTVIDAPANSEALGIAEGHVLHPDTIRWEITSNMLIAWKSHALTIGADLENRPGLRDKYRGAAVLAFPITAHFDVDIDSRPWHERRYFSVDWSRNIVGQLKRGDTEQGIDSMSLNGSQYLIDNSWVGNPNRIRVGKDYIDLTTRHPVEVSPVALMGKYGRPFQNDTAATVIDIRHSFIKKKASDFIALASPDEVIGMAAGKIKSIPINNRIGLFRTGFDGHAVYDPKMGIVHAGAINNATIFNIWKKNIDEKGQIIPMEQRQPKPIIYYANVLHPDDLMAVSQRVVKQWDEAFRNAIFYAQPAKYQMLSQVPPMLILARNSCNVDTIEHWLNGFTNDARAAVEKSAKISLAMIKRELKQNNMNFSEHYEAQIKAKRGLEQLCSALEFYTEESETPFVYQRPGDLRFNLINLVVDNNTTAWSGYGPMLSDPLSGETIAATANVNLKYIDLSAHEMSRQISLLDSESLDVEGVLQADSHSRVISEHVISEVNKRLSRMNNEGFKADRTKASRVFKSNPKILSINESRLLAGANSPIVQTNKSERDNGENPVVQFDSLGDISDDNGKNSMMDPISIVDNMSMGIALKYVNLSESERFLKIRENIYEAVLLHEIGHNLGLRHNMAASSDALNYGELFWKNQQLPDDLSEARLIATDKDTKQQLDDCLLAKNRTNGVKEGLTTTLCLQQKNPLYSSVMDYHASSMAGSHGLGLYDKAAIKWAYTQLVEVFPRHNLKVDPQKIDLKDWLKFNDYRKIPSQLLASYASINHRRYEKFEWNDFSAKSEFPINAVPYAYCEDLSGTEGPRCLAFDFGPDMKSAALWLKSKFWTNYSLSQHVQDEPGIGQSLSFKAISEDVKILQRFTHIMHWYQYYSLNEPEFAGSFAEKDYLEAVAIGMNHFAHVIGLPQPGAHVSAPIWSIEGEQSLMITIPRMRASHLLIPFNHLNECEAKSISNLNAQGEINGRQNYKFVEVPLGIGRPYYPRMTDEIENKLTLYAGSSLLKKYALYLLSAPITKNKSAANIETRKFSLMSWYQMFPEAVSKIYNSVINQQYDVLGPIINEHGEIKARDIIDEENFSLIDYRNKDSLMPSMDESLALFALTSALAFIPDNSEENLLESMKITCRGCSDDIDYGDVNDEHEVLSYTHLSGYKYKSLKFRNSESVGATLLAKANQQKERYLRLSQCINDEQIRNNDPLCQCVKTMHRSSEEWRCCEESNPLCSEPILESVGDGTCSLADLELRRNQSEDRLEQMVGFIHELRKLIKEAE
jgi:hypothetical protein